LEQPRAASAGLEQNPSTFRRRVDEGETRVAAVDLAVDQAIVLEAGDQTRHRGRLYLLGRRELTESNRAAEHYNGQC
jgi:hypothetical protein